MYYIIFLLAFLVSIIIAPFYIKFARRMKLGQNILEYVGEHKTKQGTPTMGGVIFIIPTIIVSLFFLKSNVTIPLLCLCVFLAYSIVGFLDDYIKIKFKRNLGLRPYQKILFQLLIAIIVAIFIYKHDLLRAVYIPFTTIKIDFGWLIIPYVILVFLATTNSVNLTDGLDGLAGGVSCVFFVCISLVSAIYLTHVSELQSEYITQMQNLNVIGFAVSGSLLGFLIFNFYPAKIFMGDTGSLALGALIASICLMNGTSLYIPILGFLFVLSSLSVIIQVLYYKKTKKRIFLMAPFHHHLEHKGMYETKIVFIYIVLTILIGISIIGLLGVL